MSYGIILLVLFLILIILLGIYLISPKSKYSIEKVYNITDISNNKYRIDKYYNDLEISSSGQLTFRYNATTTTVPNMPKFPIVSFYMLKSPSSPIKDTMATMGELQSVIENEQLLCNIDSSETLYLQYTTDCSIVKDKYYQAILLFPSNEMIKQLEELTRAFLVEALNISFNGKSLNENKVLQDNLEKKLKDDTNKINIKDRFVVSSIKKYTTTTTTQFRSFSDIFSFK